MQRAGVCRLTWRSAELDRGERDRAAGMAPTIQIVAKGSSAPTPADASRATEALVSSRAGWQTNAIARSGLVEDDLVADRASRLQSEGLRGCVVILSCAQDLRLTKRAQSERSGGILRCHARRIQIGEMREGVSRLRDPLARDEGLQKINMPV